MTSNFRGVPWPVGLGAVLVVAAALGCGRAGGAPEPQLPALDEELLTPPALTDKPAAEWSDGAPAGDVASQLDRLRALGRFEAFIHEALAAVEADPESAKLQLSASEARLASGLPNDGEQSALTAATLAAGQNDWPLAVRALKVWAAARFRQRKPLDVAQARSLLEQLPAADAGVQMLDFWRQVLGDRTPYRIESGGDETVVLPLADVARGSIPFELVTVTAQANGAEMPLVFIDTGGQFTLMTTEAAQAAGVVVGTSGTQLMGFRGLTAQPGVIETLELGGLTLYDVPVLVGDSAPLVALGGQLSLGTELMYHVRFHIDYPARRVTAEPTARVAVEPDVAPLWDIPVWTFSQVCLARGQLAAGPMARVLVDTGNASGTFVSYRWARRNLPGLRGASSSLVFRIKKRGLMLDGLDLGSQSLADWPVSDTMPRELDRLNQIDVIVGHDLLWPYRLSIDLPRRVLELRPGSRAAGE